MRTTGLTERQQQLLSLVVADFIRTGTPVGSHYLVTQARAGGSLGVGPSTVRAELARLESAGLLDHPHTSAGRVPTEAGYRAYAAELTFGGGSVPRPPVPSLGLPVPEARAEIEDAMRGTAEALSQVTNLLALVSAPAPATVEVRHVEVLLLQPQVAMVVVITGEGAVTKRTVAFDEVIDRGLVDWARTVLNERLTGRPVGLRALRTTFEDRSLTDREQAFLVALRPAFEGLGSAEPSQLHVGGTARIVESLRDENRGALEELMVRLEERVVLLGLLRRLVGQTELGGGGLVVRIGDEIDDPAFAGLALVGAGYGLGHRTLGAVSVLGPLRMDYAVAIGTVRAGAAHLDRLVEAASAP